MKRIREGGRQPLSDDGAGSDLVSRGERNRYFIGFGMKKQTFLNLEEKGGGCFSRAIISCMHSFLQLAGNDKFYNCLLSIMLG